MNILKKSTMENNNPESFRKKYSLITRSSESERIMEKYPDRRPIIVEKSINSDIPEIDKKKYLVPTDLTVGQFIYVIRKRINIDASKAVYLFVNNVLPPTASTIRSLYEKHKDEDGFLYFVYSAENTFGN